MNKFVKAVAELSPCAAPATLRDSVLHHLHCTLAKDQFSATTHDYYVALVYAIREQLTPHWLETQQRYYLEDKKRVYYLSMEYLTGRALSNSLLNLGLLEQARTDLAEIGLNLDKLIDAEAEAGLGNGGLGRLAACLLDSLATLSLPAYGYGIRYQYGIFQQQIAQGEQVEAPDNWLRFGNPWEIARPEDLYRVQFGGDVRVLYDSQGRLQHEWASREDVTATGYDVPITGCFNNTVNTLRLWSAESLNGFNLKYFNQGDYIAAVEQTSRSRSISRVLYPDDSKFSGKELRLKQEYFFVSASLQDIVRRYRKTRRTYNEFSDKVAIQLNDTHPALAIPELMRILVDLEQIGWDEAWEIAVATFGYTNHTLLPEALEEWPVHLLERLLPRNLQIIYEINQRFLQSVKRSYPGDVERLRRMSLINEEGEKRVRMSHLAVVGSHTINGVSQLHSELLRNRLFRDFNHFYPHRLRAITNGITPRRWLRLANPLLSELITDFIGDSWLCNLSDLGKLEDHLDDPELLERWSHVKRKNKRRLAGFIYKEQGVRVSDDSMFDCQVKRIHEYKRQLMNILHVIVLYNRIRRGEMMDLVPRTVLISGKAAPGYAIARSVVKLLHEVLEVVNHDPLIGDLLQVAFLPNYNVSLAEKIMPAVDLSQQISTTGTEASGTGNMKAILNGALIIGTPDGANIEIAEAVGAENIFLFGKTANEVEACHRQEYAPKKLANESAELGEALEMIGDGFFSAGDKGMFRPLLDSIFDRGDPYLVCADFEDYLASQKQATTAYQNQNQWIITSIKNVARSGRFSSDRTALTYARDAWGLDVQHLITEGGP